MPSLVEELQRDTLDGDVKVTALLRKAYVVATKLNLAQFKAWCDSELNGYKGPEPLPSYREINGHLQAWNPYNGWIPVIFDDPKVAEIYSSYPERSAIATIEDLLQNDDNSTIFGMKLSPAAQSSLSRGGSDKFECTIHIAKGKLVRIVDAVRNTILDWSLKLEADGIVGEGMSFSAGEKKLASKHADDLQQMISIIKIDKMENSTIQQASPKAKQRRR